LERRVLAIPETKSGKPLTIPIGPELAVELEEYIAALPPDEPYLFPSRTPGVPHLTTVKKPFKAALKLAGLPAMRYYDLRHVAITALLDDGVPIHVVARIAGHASIATTQAYAHSTDLAERMAVERLESGGYVAERDVGEASHESGLIADADAR
jgi:integrase